MHITVIDPDTKAVLGVLCVDRNAGTCIILQCDLDHLVELTNIAFGMKVKEIQMTLPAVKEVIAELEDLGWSPIVDSITMVKKHGK